MIGHCIGCGAETTAFDGEPVDAPKGLCEECRREEDES